MLELEARAEPSRLMSWLSPLLAVALMLAGGMLVFTALGKDPIEGFRVFFLNRSRICTASPSCCSRPRR
jgi:simple sugar transport system permease protein